MSLGRFLFYVITTIVFIGIMEVSFDMINSSNSFANFLGFIFVFADAYMMFSLLSYAIDKKTNSINMFAFLENTFKRIFSKKDSSDKEPETKE